MVDKDFCMSSYLAFRYIEKEDMDFYEGTHHKSIKTVPNEQRILVYTSSDIDREIGKQLEQFKDKKKGILLSGGMDSAIVASYLSGSDAYTFRFLGGEYQKEELERAGYYAKCYGLDLHYVDIGWETVEKNLEHLMRAKCAPVHSIEPQIMQGALQAKADGIELMIIGDGSDYVFGGMDQLLSSDWSFDAFVRRYICTDPVEVLKEPVSMQYLFERYRQGDKIDFISFMDDVTTEESYGSYLNAFSAAGMPYYDPYERLKMAEPLDLQRIRNGEPKYLIRELFAMKYPDIPVPNKIPMPRPVDTYFADWKGPTRPEFKKDIDMSKFTGNQKWQMYCLEKFLEMNEGQ